jgi:hypothetical protein
MTTKFSVIFWFILGILALELSGCSVPVSNTTPQPASQLSTPMPIDTATPTISASGYSDGLFTETFSPVLGATNVPTRPFFQWPSIRGAVSYDFQLADNPFYTNPIEYQTGLTVTAWEEPKTLEQGKSYYWRVRGIFTGWVDDWITSSFTTTPINPAAPMPTLAPIPKSVIHGDLLPGVGGAGDLVIDSGTTNVTIKPMFEWPAMKGAVNYDLQMADNPVFNNPLA